MSKDSECGGCIVAPVAI